MRGCRFNMSYENTNYIRKSWHDSISWHTVLTRQAIESVSVRTQLIKLTAHVCQISQRNLASYADVLRGSFGPKERLRGRRRTALSDSSAPIINIIRSTTLCYSRRNHRRHRHPTITIIILSLTHGKCHIGCLIINNYWMSFLWYPELSRSW